MNVKVAYATHEAPFSPRGRRVGEEGETVHDFHHLGYLDKSWPFAEGREKMIQDSRRAYTLARATETTQDGA